MNNRVGIYMPCYNSSSYIKQSIESIIQQTFHDWKLVIIDDYSDDDTYDVAMKMKEVLPYISHYKFDPNQIEVYRREEHAGKIGMIKNEAIAKLPDCDYICHVGSDDFIPNYCLQIFVDFMEANRDIGAACGNFECFDNKGKQWRYPHVENSGEFNPDIMLSYMCMFPMRFYRKETIEAVGGYSNELSSAVDYDLALRISENFTIKRIKEPITYYYRRHKNQASTKGKPEQDKNAKIALQNTLERRNIKMEVVNNMPPFQLKNKEEKIHKIWGKK